MSTYLRRFTAVPFEHYFVFKADVDISQGSVEMRVRCGGILNHLLIANLLLSVPVKEC